MKSKDQHKYEILRILALAGAKGDAVETTLRSSLEETLELVGLNAAAVYLWDANMGIKLNVAASDSPEAEERLAFLEKGLFRNLRAESELVSAYMSFGGKKPCHAFSHPLSQKSRIFGAVIGLQFGERTVVSEDLFLETLSAAIAVHALATGKELPIPKEVLDKERLAAIVETAVTVNHEVNNPLTAILGNVQLLLMKKQDLDDETRAKLEVIEMSAGKIKDVTQKLLKLTSPRTVDYSEGTSMIDISDELEDDSDSEPDDTPPED